MPQIRQDVGDLLRAEADEIERGVARAAESQGRWVDERVLTPLRNALRAAAAPAAAGGIAERLAAIEARLDRIEAALASRERDTER